MPFNKLVIRRLPPTLSEEEFLKQISPLPRYDYFCYFESNSGLGQHCYNRAYINFLDANDMSVFRERFDNYVFLDKDGNEYPAVVEQSLWHKSPISGPFFKSDDEPDRSSNDTSNWTPSSVEPSKSDNLANEQNSSKLIFLEEDPEFLKFVEKINSQKKIQSSRH